MAADVIEAHPLNPVSARHDHAVLVGYLESWKGRHAEADVEILDR
jgi:hypothetical protein